MRSLPLAALVVALTTAPAFATTKVALTIAGDSRELRDAVAGALDGSDLEVVEMKWTVQALNRLGVEGAPSARDAARLATELDVQTVMVGTIDPRTHKLRLTFYMNGKKGGVLVVRVDDTDSSTFRKQVRAAILTKLGTPEKKAAKDVDDDGEVEHVGKHKKKHADDAAEVADDDTAKAKTKAKKGKHPADAEDVADDGAKPKAGKKAKHADEVADGDDTAKAKPKTKGKHADEVADSDDTAKAKGKHAGADDDADTVKPKTKGKHAGADDDADIAKPKTKGKHHTDDVADDTAKPKTKGKHAADADVADDGVKTKGKHAADADEADDKAKGSPDASGDPAAKQVAAADGDDAPAGRDAPGGGDAMTANKRFELAEPRGANLATARVNLGVSLAGRSLRFTSSSFPGAPTPYRNTPVTGGRVEGEVYPLATRSGALAVGLAGDFDQTASLTLHASDEMTVPVKVTERHYSVGARFRIALGSRPTSPTVTLGVGYAARTFKADRSGLMSAGSLDLPDVDYRMIDPGLTFRLPLGRVAAVTVGGRALLVSSAGPIADADQYGKTSARGGTASGGLELVFGRVAVRVVAEATELDLTFAGTGTLATSRDAEPSTIDVRGATDRYYGGAATLAVMY